MKARLLISGWIGGVTRFAFLLVLLLASSSILAWPASAQQPATPSKQSNAATDALSKPDPRITQVMEETVVVQIPIPQGLTKDKIRSLFTREAPSYTQVDGLIRKYFIVSNDKEGGVYLFKTRQQAEAWFNAAWHDSVRQTFGVDAEVLMFETPVIVDNTIQAKISSRA